MKELRPLLIKLDGNEKYRTLLKKDNDTVRIKSGLSVLQKGESVGKHVTTAREEVILILQGKAEVTAGTHEPIIVHEKEMVYMPPEMEHDVRNIGDIPLKYVYVVAML